MHVAVRNGKRGDTSAYMFNVKKVYDAAVLGSFTGVEGQSYWVDGTSETEGLHWGIKTTMPMMLKGADLRSKRVGLGLRALGGIVPDDNGRTSPDTAFAAIGTASDGGKWYRVLVASPTENANDRFFQITAGADRQTPTMHFGMPAIDVVLRYIGGVFQIMDTGGLNPLVNIHENGAPTEFFTAIKVNAGTPNAAALTRIYSATGALDFPSIAPHSAQSLTATLTGVASGDEITVTPASASNGNLTFRAEFDSANTVKVWAQNISTAAIDPGSSTFRIVARRFA